MRSMKFGVWGRMGCALLVSVILAACGGGGGGGNPSGTSAGASSSGGSGSGSSTSGGGSANGAGVFSATVNGGPLTTTAVAGTPDTLTFSLALAYTGSGNLYLVLDGDQQYLSALNGSVDGNLLDSNLTLSPTLAPGSYTSTLYLHACLDDTCSSEASGSPVAIPLAFTVYPNIQVQSTLSLTRTGNAAAPGATLPVTAPAAAGPLVLTVNDPAAVFSAAFDGSTLSVGTTQVRAGTYTSQLTLTGALDGRFTRTVAVSYTVLPPPGGEEPLTVTPYNNNFNLAQGSTASAILTLTPPTWTNVIDPPVIQDSTGMLSVTPLGNNTYQLGVNAAGAPLGSYSGSVNFTAGPTGGSTSVEANWNVASTIYPATYPTLNIDPTTTPADLSASTPIATFSGTPASWTASTTTPWITLTRTSGTSGTNPLTMRFAEGFFTNNPGNFTGSFTLSSSLPGTQPQVFPVTVSSTLPLVQRSAAVLTGTSGRLYVQGQFAADLAQLQSVGALQISGATVTAETYRTDGRFLSLLRELTLDLGNAVPGTPIVIKAQTPLANSQISVAVQAPRQVSSGFSALPYAAYRPSGYAPGQDAFYFSAPDTLLRWAEAAGQWTLTQSTASGLSGLALRPDEQYLYGVAGTSVLRFDPVTLIQNGHGGPFSGFDTPVQGNTILDQFDPGVPSLNASLVFASDARAIASNEATSAGVEIHRSANWIASLPFDSVADLTLAPQIADPGNGPWGLPDLPIGIGLVASPNHHVVAGTTSTGQVALYASTLANWAAAPPTTPGTLVVGVSDDGTRTVRSDGSVVDGGGTLIGNLTSVLPFTQQPGGFALTQDGHYGLVYGYSFNPANGAQPARGATLTVVDLSQAPAVPLSSTAIVTTLALSSPVGCTTSTLAPGETCAHSAALSVAPGSASVFVLGPRGVAAVPLPNALAVNLARAARAAAQRIRAAAVPRLRRPVGMVVHP